MSGHTGGAPALLWAAVCGLLLAGCEGGVGPGERVWGSGSIVEREVVLTGFTGVQVGFGVHADITVGTPERVVLRGDDNLLALIQMKVVQGMLVADRDPRWAQNPPTPSEPIRLTVVTPRLTQLRVSGGALARASGVDSPDFSLHASGGSEVGVSGQAGRLTLEASGGSAVDLREFVLNELELDASGGSRVHANVSGSVSGDLSGGAQLTCEGQPTSRGVSTSSGSGVNYP